MSRIWDTPGYTDLVLHEKRLPDCFSATIGETPFDILNSSGNAFDRVFLTTCAF